MSRPDQIDQDFLDLYRAGLTEASVDPDGEVRYRLIQFTCEDGRRWYRHPEVPQ